MCGGPFLGSVLLQENFARIFLQLFHSVFYECKGDALIIQTVKLIWVGSNCLGNGCVGYWLTGAELQIFFSSALLFRDLRFVMDT